MKANYWLIEAKKSGFALGAFNVFNLETLKAVVSAATKEKAPVIIEASEGEVNYFGKNELVALVRTMEDRFRIPLLLNLDHASTYENCRKAIELGFDLIHFDGSKLSRQENLETTKKIVAEAHQKNILVEGEIDKIPGGSFYHREKIEEVRKQGIYTDPGEAYDFINQTGVDIFSVFVGNVHGLYSEIKNIDLKLLRKISQKLPQTFFSLHGGSGITEKQLKKAISLGIVKININTELRLAFKENLRKTLNTCSEIALYKVLPSVIEEVRKIVSKKIILFGSSGKAV